MAPHDDPADPAGPQEVIEAAEAAHLATRRGEVPAPAPPAQPPSGDRPSWPVPPPPSPPRFSRLWRRRAAPGGALAKAQRAAPGRGAAAGPATRRRRRAPLPLAAVVATGWAALISFLPVALFVGLLMLAETGPTGLVEPLRVAGAGWLLGHGVPLQTPVGPLGITPLALTALAAWRLTRAGLHVTRAIGARRRGSGWQAIAAATAIALGYGGLGALAGFALAEQDWRAPVLTAGLTLAGFAFVAAGLGALHATGVLTRWSARLPAALPAAIRAGVIASAGVLAAGAVLAGAAVAVNWRSAGDILAVYETGVAGQAGLTVLCLAFVPNLAAWGAAYLIGPGFAVGTGTVVRSSEVVAAEPLPALPVFAGLPDAPMPTLGALLLVVPVVAGALAGRVLTRSVTGWLGLLLGVVVAGAVGGALLGAVAAGSGGALGGGGLAGLGPDPLPVAGFAAATIAAGALVGVAAFSVLTRRRH